MLQFSFKKYLLPGLAIFFYLISLAIAKYDTVFTFSWLAFTFFMLDILYSVYLWIRSLPPIGNTAVGKQLNLLPIIVALAIFPSFLLLKMYPYISLGDQLRDGGLNALQIHTGEIKNIFAYGTAEAHGLIIPTISSFFYPLFGSSVLVYRVPAAIFSVLDVTLMYCLICLVTKNKIISLLGSLTLLTFPLHLFYARTELVVILNSFFATTSLITLFIFLKRKALNTYDYIFCSVFTGFLMNFHASLKGLAFLYIGLLLVANIVQLVRKKQLFTQFLKHFTVTIIFLFVGFGPIILHTNTSILFHKTRIPVAAEKKIYFSKTFLDVSTKYKDSLLVWFSKPTASWYPDHKPITTHILFSLMILGILYGFKKKNLFLVVLLPIALILHFTNSAITDLPNADHRLSPLLPFSALYISIGCFAIFQIVKNKYIRFILSTLFVLYLSKQLFFFFKNQPANLDKNLKQYLSMNTIYFLKNNTTALQKTGITLELSPSNFQEYSLLHYKEQYRYFFPATPIKLVEKKDAKDNEIFITTNERDNFQTFKVKCTPLALNCPLQYQGTMMIYFR